MADCRDCPLASQAKFRPWLGKVCAEAASVALPLGIGTPCATVTPRPALRRASHLGARLKISPAGWSLDFGQGRHGHGGLRPCPSRPVSPQGQSQPPGECPSGQALTGAQLGMMGRGNGPQSGGAMSPQAFWAPLDTPHPLPGTGGTGRCWPSWSSPTRASQAGARRLHLLCHPDVATPCSSVFPSLASTFQSHPNTWAGQVADGEERGTAWFGAALRWGTGPSAANLLCFLGAEDPELHQGT